MRTNHFMQRIAVICGLTLYTLLVAEACVRLMNPQPLVPRYITGTSWGVRGNIPHAVYHHHTPEVDVEYRINGQGMRDDRELPFEKPAGICRIALFGDSFMVGYELDLRDTIATQLQNRLLSEGYRVEVLNFAVSGFGTGEMLRTYDSYARKFDPDMVVFQWHVTDFDDNLRSGLYTLSNDQVISVNRDYLPSVRIQDALMKFQVYRMIADNSHLYAWLRERVALIVKDLLVTFSKVNPITDANASAKANAIAVTAPPAVNYSALLSAQMLRYAEQHINADGRSFLVLDIPQFINRTTFESSWKHLPSHIIESVDVIHAGDTLRPLASPDTKLYFERGHGHFTPVAAHALGADVATRIGALDFLRKCRP